MRRIIFWARTVGLGRKAAIAITVAALLSAFATYAAITGMPPFGPDPRSIVWLLNLNLVLLLALGFIVIRRLVVVWTERRRGLAGSRLHIRLVMLFGAVAIAPTIVVAIFSALFLNIGIQGWFSERVSSALENSRAVANAYLHEHTQNIRADILAMASDINQEASLFMSRQRLAEVLNAQTALRALTEAVIYSSSGEPLARTGLSFSMDFEPLPLIQAMQQARRGEPVIMTSESDDRVRALLKLDGVIDGFLFVGRPIDPLVVSYVDQTERAVAAYQKLEGQRSGLQVTFALVFVVLAVLLLLVATWVGLTVATKLAEPISLMIGAAERIRTGDLSVRVPDRPEGDELGSLARAFNRMTSQLETQRSELVEANRQLDERRRFTETVLAGVSAGVIGLDGRTRINLPNRSAAELLSLDFATCTGEPLGEIVPELADLLDQTVRRPDRRAEAQVKLTRQGRTRTLLARATAEMDGEEVSGYVVTFDDVTELMAAQRTAAWADVARRIAHEIKNPLTPIQLSAERLKRKYLKEITSDPETFTACTDTIVRQVGDIGRMVDEFSAFARMPAPVMKREELGSMVREATFLMRSARADIAYQVDVPEQPVHHRCDGRQIRQALINLLQNAADAIDGRQGDDLPPGIIRVVLEDGQGTSVLTVEDNGKGLPSEERERLTEPYVTTRAKGTGLGLAIVKKIMEDHAGELVLADRPGGGARVALVLPAVDVPSSETEQAVAVNVS